MTDTTDVATVDEQLPAPQGALQTLLPGRDETDRIWRLATQLQHTEFVPTAMQGRPDKILAAVLTGREMGVPPMRALKHINIIEGSAQPSAELHLSQALDKGHRVEVIETTREKCTVEVQRADWPPDKIRHLTWELDDAVQAGLCQLTKEGKPYARSKQKGEPLPWEKYPRQMLRARTVTEAIHAWMPDAIAGLDYLPPVEPDAPAPVTTVGASDGSTHSLDAATGEILDSATTDAVSDPPAEPAAPTSGADTAQQSEQPEQAAGNDAGEDELERLIAALAAAGDDVDGDMWRNKASESSNSRHAVMRTLESRLSKLAAVPEGSDTAQDGDDSQSGSAAGGDQPEFPFDPGGPASQEATP